MFETLFADIATAAGMIFTVQSLLAIAGGVVLGHYMGAIPGLTSSMAIALLIPVTFYLPTWVAISMLLGIYKGALFADSTAAILLRTPGMPAAAAVMIDGNALTRQGKSGKALKMALYSSVIGDTISDLALIFGAGLLAAVALSFGPPEYAALMVFALTIIAGVAGRSMLKGVASTLFGLLLATVGTDPVTATPRLTFGSIELMDGFSLIPLLIGLLALSEVFSQFEKQRRRGAQGANGDDLDPEALEGLAAPSTHPDDNRVTREDFRRSLPSILRGSGIGTVLGAVPGLGATVASFLSYNEARRASKHPERFGKGAIEGVAAADSASSAVSGSNMIPLLAFGIPGDVVAAIMLGAFLIHGIIPGPMVFQNDIHVIYAIFIGLLMANFSNLILGQVFIRIAVKVLTVPRSLLFPIIVAITVVGSYSLNGNFSDVKVMLAFGVLGFLMMKFGYSPISLLIGFVLGPMLETNIRRTLILSGDSVLVFFTRPISLGIIIVAALTLFAVLRLRRSMQDSSFE